MEYKDYIDDVKKLIKNMSEQEKTDWIYNYARTCNKSNWHDLLKSLTSKTNEDVQFNQDEFDQFIDEVENQELWIESREEEYYDESVHDYNSNTVYLTNCKLLIALNNYISTAIKLIENEDYLIGFEILDKLSQLMVVTNNEYGYVEELSLNDLYDRNLIWVVKYVYYQNFLYAAFNINKSIEEIYLIFKQYGKQDLVFSDLLAFGSQELKFDHQFYQNWIDFLENEPGDLAANLIKDACYLDGGIDKLTTTVTKIGEIHPLLYQETINLYLKKNDIDQAVKIGLQAITKIPEQFIARANIAKTLIPYYSDKAFLYEVAFLSNPTVFNCLRLYSEKCDFDYIKETFKQINYQDDNVIFSSQAEEYAINCLNNYQRQIINYLLNDFDIIEKLDEIESLDIKEIFMFLSIMLLKDHNLNFVADKNIIEELENYFDISDFDKNNFEKYLKLWKQSININKIQKEKLINWLTKSIIIDNMYKENYVNKDKKLASLIVGLAEVLYSNQEIENIETYIQEYLTKYSCSAKLKSELMLASQQIIDLNNNY